MLSAKDFPYGFFVFFTQYFPPFLKGLLILLQILALPLIVLGVNVLLFEKFNLFRRCGNKAKKAFRICLKISHGFVNVIFPSMKPAVGHSTESPKTECFGYLVPDTFICLMFYLTFFLVDLTAIVFFETLALIKRSSVCNATSDDTACFSINSTWSSKTLNCSIEGSTFYNTTPEYQCFRFVCNITEALSMAGGILNIAVISVTALVTLILLISGGKNGYYNKKRRYCTYFLQTSMLIVTVGVLCAVGIIAIDFFEYTPYKFSVMDAPFFCFILMLTLLTPWWDFERAPIGLAQDTQTNLNGPDSDPQNSPADHYENIYLLESAPRSKYHSYLEDHV